MSLVKKHKVFHLYSKGYLLTEHSAVCQADSPEADLENLLIF